MKILVTGGTGFLGSHLVPRLVEQGHAVRLLARGTAVASGGAPAVGTSSIAGAPVGTSASSKNVEWMRGDLLDAGAVKRALEGCEAIYHLAGLVSFRPEDARAMYALHVEGTRQLLEAASVAGIQRVILASTSGTIAVSKEEKLWTEAHDYPLTVVGRWPYYLSKIYEEKLALSLCREKNLPLVVLNPSLLMGPGDERLSSTWLVTRHLAREVPVMPSGGLSFVDVRDAADAFAAALTRGELFGRHLMGVNMSFRDFFGRLERLTGVPAPRIRVPSAAAVFGSQMLKKWVGARGGDPVEPQSVEMGEHFFYLDAAKAERVLGFHARDPHDTLFATVQDVLGRMPPQSLPGTKGRLRATDAR